MSSSQTLQEIRRAKPKQARSIQTVENLLDTSALLLEEVGFSNFTTNLLSERSGVSIRAIYRYFPNKHALVMELALRLTESWQTEQADHGAVLLSDSSRDWRVIWPDYLDRFVATVRTAIGGIAIMNAMRSDPLLRKLDREIHENYTKDVTESLLARESNLTRKEATVLSSVLIQSAVGVISASFEQSPKEASLAIDMLKTMQLNLLSDWLAD